MCQQTVCFFNKESYCLESFKTSFKEKVYHATNSNKVLITGAIKEKKTSYALYFIDYQRFGWKITLLIPQRGNLRNWRAKTSVNNKTNA